MKAPARSLFILPTTSLDVPTREGEVLEVGGVGGEPPYLVMWAGGLLHPAPASVMRADAEQWYAAGAPGEVPLSDVTDPPVFAQSYQHPEDSSGPQIVDELARLRARRKLADRRSRPRARRSIQ